jgi:hypothetical protein
MAHDDARIREFARSYTDAWYSHDPTKVADRFVPGGTIAINGGDPTEVTEVARSFVDAFPDIKVFMDDVVLNDETVEYHWTFTGTNTGPDGTGKWVRISGFEEWTIGDDGLVVESRGSYESEYTRQLEDGAPETQPPPFLGTDYSSVTRSNYSNAAASRGSVPPGRRSWQAGAGSLLFELRSSESQPRSVRTSLHRRVPLSYCIFDVLRRDGEDLTGEPYISRRTTLEELRLGGPSWTTSETFEDGPALFDAVCRLGLEGVVAKRLSSRYRSGEHGWIKTKNPNYWRRDSEREAMQRSRERRQRTRV